MLKIAMIGCGAIGASVLELLHGDSDVVVDRVITVPEARDRTEIAVARWAPRARVLEVLAADDAPDLVVECAGHGAIAAHVVPALERGIPCVVTSVGALSAPGMAQLLEQAARRGKTQVQLLSGAIGGIDALAAARVGGLDSVVYTGRKPPMAWKGTPAEAVCDLDSLTVAHCIFDGSAEQAAQLYPKNANVAATLSLAGLGLKRTQVQLFADPGVSENVHHVAAHGAFGSFELTMRGRPLAANPKTSALTVYSVVRALLNRGRALVI
ncbi:aspartate dehydrogenase [Polaromonas sp. JS666]|uniref:L-aspartate dehydrogenase n=1 Tax=Polaromonas sp. (strain JS666 / ATCC BAA-500) TaxID=296591 RepID=ASPD_POLSJ|nr:aspartate dehydrogenase [Polaromonas sp. JS666]Q126F5.1 RecName: Full=L-aspartate dehydrogenase [Polaromonas sp. JS666]ABE45587.1 aspartate dehydrogenase [Polaromonas sp. JS666]